MKKRSLIYSDLSKKQLQHLKEIYIQKKVDSMSEKELRKFVIEVISHQITDTIDKEEEMEAWCEMSDFFGEEFEIIITEIQKKFLIDVDPGQEENLHKQRQELIERNSNESTKTDMWDD